MKTQTGLLLAATALATVLPAEGTLAADLPVKAPPIVAAAFDWSGVYIGAHAGYGGGMKDWQPGGQPQSDFIASGALAGGQIGINKQLGSFVFGLELAGSWADIDGKMHYSVGPGVGTTANIDSASRIDGLVTFAARAGLAADRWFVFAKAGLSAVHEKHSAATVLGINGVINTLSASGDEVRVAPMLGFGTEYALSGNWSLFAEYNFHYLGDRPAAFRGLATFGGPLGPIAFDERIDQSIHVAKAGINYRFGGVGDKLSYAAVRPTPGTDWTGGYVGVQGGYGWGSQQWPSLFGTPADYGIKGWLAGGTVGANAQAGSLVFGVEGEILATGIKGSQTNVLPVLGAGNQFNSFENKIDWLALATARAGFAAGGNWLLYGKGGVAVAQEAHTVSLTAPGLGVAGSLSATIVHTGVVVGAGAEYAFAPNWSVKAEYDYIRMFQQAAIVSGSLTGGPFGAPNMFVQAPNKLSQDLQLVKFGVNYHFNPVQAVTAKY